MGRRLEQCGCCCITETPYPYDPAYTVTATDDRFDVNAHFVSLARPLRGQGTSIFYATAPTGSEFESVARVKVLDQVEATLTAKLVQREMPADWFPIVAWNFDATKSYYFPSGGAYSSVAVPYSGADSSYALDVNDCPATSSIFQYKTNPDEYVTVFGSTDLPEPAGSGSPAWGGTPLASLSAPAREGLGGIVVYSEDVSLRTRWVSNIIDGGWITSPFPQNWPNANIEKPMQCFGYDSSFFLTFGEESRWVICGGNDSPRRYDTAPSYGIYPQGFSAETIQPGRRSLANLTLNVASHLPSAYPGDVSETGYFTAYAYRPNMPPTYQDSGRRKYTTQYPIAFAEATHEDDRSETAYFGYTNKTVKKFGGNEISVYRNGTLVLQSNYPTAEQSRAATAEDGTYLVVSEITGASDDPSVPQWYATFEFRHKHFYCVVVDRTPPVVAFEAGDDFFGSNPTSNNWAFTTAVLATEPVYGYRTAMLDLDDTGIVVAGYYPQLTSSVHLGGGVYRQRPTGYGTSFLHDLAGNPPAATMQHDLKIWPYPAKFLLTGAKPTLQKYERRTRTQSERIATIRMEFDRKIDPAGVSSSQLTVEKNNVAISGATLEPIGDGSREWLIKIPVDEQTPRSFFVVTYAPAGAVYTNDIETLRYSSRESFPTTGRFRTKYVYADDDGKDHWFSWSFGGYVSIAAGEFPLYPYGGRYEPEPCVLAARTSWLMADTNGHPRYIDCQSWLASSQLGRVASIGKTITVDTTKTTSEVESNEPGMPVVQGGYNGNIYGRSQEVFYKPKQNRRGFIPAVPSPTSPRAGCSYFGLTTTIDPSPPAAVHECAAPSEHQKHSSIIISDGELETFIASLELRDSSGNIVTDFSSRKQYIYADAVAVGGGQQKYFAPEIMARNGAEYTFSSTLQGRPLSQNVWSCIDGARDGNFYTEEISSRPAPIVCADNQTAYYAFTMTENGGTVFARGNSSGMMRKTKARYSQDAIQAVMSAARSAYVYPNLYTTTLTNLALYFSFRMTVKRITTYTDYAITGSPVGYKPWYSSGVCPNTLVAGSSFSATNIAVYAASQMQQVGQPREVVGRFFDCISGKVFLSKLEEVALGQGQTIRKELFVQNGTQNIWTIKLRKG